MPEEIDEDAKPRCAPVFVSKPEPVIVEEGEWARFCARVTGHPKPRVMWLINGHTVVNVSTTLLSILSMEYIKKIFSILGFPIQAHLRWHVSL